MSGLSDGPRLSKRAEELAIPPTPPVLLRGRSIRFWVWVELGLMAGIALPSSVLALLSMLIAIMDDSAGWASTMVYVFLDVAAVAGCGMCGVAVFMWQAMRRERRAGYTTLNLSGWRFNGFGAGTGSRRGGRGQLPGVDDG